MCPQEIVFSLKMLIGIAKYMLPVFFWTEFAYYITVQRGNYQAIYRFAARRNQIVLLYMSPVSGLVGQAVYDNVLSPLWFLAERRSPSSWVQAAVKPGPADSRINCTVTASQIKTTKKRWLKIDTYGLMFCIFLGRQNFQDFCYKNSLVYWEVCDSIYIVFY